jgi:hypothetical protein
VWLSLPAGANAAQAPVVAWCGAAPATADAPDAVTGRQVHVIYAAPSEGPDRFPSLATGIASDLSAIVAWWQHQDYTRAPRFDLAAAPCLPTLGAVDLSDVRLPHDSSYYSDEATRFGRIAGDLADAGFANPFKKYLVYYDTPSSLPGDLCGQGHEDPTNGGASGYAIEYGAPNLRSTPESSGCGQLESPDTYGGYTAVIAAHELLHTLGALDTWDQPGPPHPCPGSTAHACDNPLDIMEPAGSTFWLDNVVLDFGHDDYYAHSGTWWDVQDSMWLRHLNEPTHSLDVSLGDGVASVSSDLPGLLCRPGEPCHSVWDNATAVVLAAEPADGYSRIAWGGACASAGSAEECSLTLGADTAVTVSFLKALSVAGFSARATRTRVQAELRTSRAPAAGEASVRCAATKDLKLVTHAVRGASVKCEWTVPVRLRGKRVSGSVEVDADDGTVLSRRFALAIAR